MKATNLIITLAVYGFSALAWSPDTALARQASADSRIAYYQRLLRRSPLDARSYYGLADALIRKAREGGDPAYFGLAENALNAALKLDPKNAGALRHLAYVFYSRHQFDEAAQHAQKAIDIDSTDGNAHAILGDSLLETGKYARAEESYREMMRRQKDLYSYSRLAALKTVRGDTAGATADLERAIALGKAAMQPAESVAWAQWQLGNNYFATGDLAKAEIHYQQSLKTFPNYHRALAGLAQVRAAKGRYDEAIGLYQRALGIIPMPEYVASLGVVFEKIGRADEARKQYQLVEYIGKLNAINQSLYNRELAYFYADHDIKLAEALELAKRELDYRRDIYAYDLLAWSLYKNGGLEEARDAMEKALRLGTKDAKLFYHAGMIYGALGAKGKAAEFLARTLGTNPHFHPLFADTAARTLMQLEGSLEQANATHEPEEG